MTPKEQGREDSQCLREWNYINKFVHQIEKQREYLAFSKLCKTLGYILNVLIAEILNYSTIFIPVHKSLQYIIIENAKLQNTFNY